MPFNLTVPAITATVWQPSPATTTSPSPSRLISPPASTTTCAVCYKKIPHICYARHLKSCQRHVQAVTYSLGVCAGSNQYCRV
jgi:hypothetical protein